MTNEELISKIKAEIERRMDKHWEGLPNADAPEDDWTHNELCELGAYKELEHFETFLSDLESEKPINQSTRQRLAEWSKTPEGRAAYEKVAEEMRREISEKPMQEGLEEDVERWFFNEISSKINVEHSMYYYFQECACRYAQWGAEHAKEQMMKEAVEGVVMDFSSNQPRPQVDVYVDPNKYCTGDKVRIIIIKG